MQTAMRVLVVHATLAVPHVTAALPMCKALGVPIFAQGCRVAPLEHVHQVVQAVALA